MQDEILKKFFECFKGMNFNEVSSLLGIKKSRLFRIFNGSEMVISELELFIAAINSCQNLSKSKLQ